jgi:hypothetical protein
VKPVWRAVALAMAVALAVEVGVVVTTLLRRAPRGPASSSYAAGHRGARGYARLLEKGGHHVRRQRVPVDVERPDPADTVVILGGSRPDRKQVDALFAFVRAGGRLVVAGDEHMDAWVTPFTRSTVRRGGELLACRPLQNVAETRGVRFVESSGQPGFADTGAALPILGCNGSALAAVAAEGQGRVVLVSDPAVFQNYLLGARQNAAFAVAAAGGVNRDVVFLEYLHGFGAPSGLAAIPFNWQVAAAVLALAGLLALAAGRRLTRHASPSAAADHPRTAHAEAVAERLAGTDARDAARTARGAALRAVAASSGLPPDATEPDVREAAAKLGIAGPDVELVLRGPDDEAATVAAARILAACRPKEFHA